MLRHAARLRALPSRTTPASACCVAGAQAIQRSFQLLSVPTNNSSHAPGEPPASHTVLSTACFSSAPQLQVKDSAKNDDFNDHHLARIMDAAAHAKFKAPKDERRNKQKELSTRSSRKKDLKRRRMLAEELMHIFAESDECFNLTLRELNIDKTWGEDTGLSEYRQFYLDSLLSFGKMLSEDHGDEKDLAQLGLSSASAINLLEQFAAVMSSASDDDARELRKKYIKMAKMTGFHKSLKASLEQGRKRYDKRAQEVKVEERLLEQLESEQARERAERISSLNKKVASAKELLPSLSTRNYAKELDKIEKELYQALSQVEELSGSKPKNLDLVRQRKKVDQAKTAAKKLAKRISELESQMEQQTLPMTEDEFQSTTENITRVAPYVAPALAKFIVNRHDDFDKYRRLEMHTDLTKPQEWYPRARLDKRKVIFHAGPTNSGKTYNALQRLKQAKKGMYLAPLRLLAAETYESLTSEGIYTSLLTGQEQRNVPFSTHRSSTVELACLDEDYDVVVIDEIQMVGDEFRGFAWTRAFLGVRCKEIHVCGGTEAVDIVKKMCRMSGDDFELHKYERFSNLTVLEDSLAKSSTARGSYANVQPGDCVVAFSRQDIFAIKREIEHMTPHKCCVVYGSLPPDVRAEQARKFNDPTSEYDILVASDAIGMGLNLSIKRIVFNSLFKHNGARIIQLDHSSVKQIAGRAGRRNSPYPHGEVTCRDPSDMAHLRKCMGTEIQPLKKAGLIPTPSHIALFNQHLQEYGSSEKDLEIHRTLRKFSEMATLKGDFFLCRKEEMEIVSQWLKDVSNLTTEQKFTLCMSPVNKRCPKSKRVLMRYIDKYTNGSVPGIHFSMRPRPARSMDELANLCGVHHQLELFMWLQGKLPSNAVEVQRAATLKETAIGMIHSGLSNAQKLSLQHDYIAKDARTRKQWAGSKSDNEESGEFEGA